MIPTEDTEGLVPTGAKGEGLAMLSALGMRTPETVVVAVEHDEWWRAFPGFPYSVDGRWILRSSPLAPWRWLPRLSGLFATVEVETSSALPDCVQMLRRSQHDQEALDQAGLFGIDLPGVTGLLQPLLAAEVSGITHVGVDGALHCVWTSGHLSRLADGTRSGNRLSSHIGSSQVTGPSEQEPELRRHRGGVLMALRAMAPLNAASEPLEIEWLVTPDGEFYALQAQLLETEAE